MRIKTIVALATVSFMVALSVAPLGIVSAQSCGTTVTVTPANLQGWQTQTSGTGQTVTFVSGPATPPLGVGSAQFDVGPDGDGAAQLRNPNYAGTLLSDLTTLKYATYVQQWVDSQAPYIMLNVDYDGNGTIDDFLFFEPVYQSSAFFPSHPQGPLTLNTWQTWDALNGGWWSANGTAGAGPGTDVKPLSAIITAQPNATIVNAPSGNGGVRIVAGFGAGSWDNFIGNADAFSIGVSSCDTTFNFEPKIGPPADANACKKDGWKTFNTPRPFKNQGDCVSYTVNGK